MVSGLYCAAAARLTDRCKDQATRPRHRRTDMARNPRKAPTMMKTVPSGKLDVCIYGAFDVGGTDGATIRNSPEIEGRPVGRAPPPVAEEPPVIVGIEPVAEADEPEPVMETEED